jgi:hypothetical protein
MNDSITPEIDALLRDISKDYKSIFKSDHKPSKSVVDELAEKIEQITLQPVEVPREESEEKVEFKNGTTINEQSIADIIDAFVKFRDTATLNRIDDSNLSRVLITLNSLVNINFDRSLAARDNTFADKMPQNQANINSPEQIYKQNAPDISIPAVYHEIGGGPSFIYSSNEQQVVYKNNEDPMMRAERIKKEGDENKNSGY